MSGGVAPILILYMTVLVGGIVGTAILALRARRLPRGEQLPLSLALLAAGATCCGGAGLLAHQLFEFGTLKSLLAALLFALLSAALFGFLARFARQAAARRAALDDLVGGLAAVVVPIAPGRVGAVATRTAPPTLTIAAISRHAEPLPIGTTVVVTATRTGRGDGAVEVAPLPAGEATCADAAS